ncbi:hypothetical protein AMTRI_Chr02g213240 [Amborella trichopoda]|uniref:Uncharacterized protein n=1 Tax=Amborella trichopoda TaxID=13333 RepID=U5CXI7_AMBTC|nr:hypothetical protein AMTR_s00032p00155090 [Amborella trichopoda]
MPNSIRDNVNHSGGKDDTGRKGFYHKERAAFGFEGRDRSPNNRKANSYGSCKEDACDRGELEGQGFGLIEAGFLVFSKEHESPSSALLIRGSRRRVPTGGVGGERR